MGLLVSGRMPMTPALPEPWWATQNIHLCSLADFVALTETLGVRIEASAALAAGRPARPIDPRRAIENWRAEEAIFLLSRPDSRPPPPPAGPPSGDLFGG